MWEGGTRSQGFALIVYEPDGIFVRLISQADLGQYSPRITFILLSIRKATPTDHRLEVELNRLLSVNLGHTRGWFHLKRLPTHHPKLMIRRVRQMKLVYLFL